MISPPMLPAMISALSGLLLLLLMVVTSTTWVAATEEQKAKAKVQRQADKALLVALKAKGISSLDELQGLL